MNTTILTVGSVTIAMKVRKLLSKKGIRSKLIKVDASKATNGCSYGIKILSEVFYDAVILLRDAGIDYSVYQG